MSELERVQTAGASYTDWVGTAAAEGSVLATSGDLYKLAGLDRARWTILGIDLTASSHGKEPRWTVRVYAVDNADAEVSSYEDLKALEARRGSVPVTDVLLHDVVLDDVIKTMKSVHFQLLSHDFTRLDRVARGDHPEQP